MYKQPFRRLLDKSKSFINSCIVELEDFCDENQIVNNFNYSEFIEKIRKSQVNFKVSCDEFYECGDYKMILKSFGGRIVFKSERSNWRVKKTLMFDGCKIEVNSLTKLNDYLVLNAIENKTRYAS